MKRSVSIMAHAMNLFNTPLFSELLKKMGKNSWTYSSLSISYYLASFSKNVEDIAEQNQVH